MSARVMELMQAISRKSPELLLAEFTRLEMREAQIVAFEGGNKVMQAAISALLHCLQLREDMGWNQIPGSRPSHNVKVWISYLYDGKPAVDVAFIDHRGWFLDGTEIIPVRPYAWKPFVPDPAEVGS